MHHPWAGKEKICGGWLLDEEDDRVLAGVLFVRQCSENRLISSVRACEAVEHTLGITYYSRGSNTHVNTWDL